MNVNDSRRAKKKKNKSCNQITVLCVVNVNGDVNGVDNARNDGRWTERGDKKGNEKSE